MTKYLGGVRLCVRIRHYVFSRLVFGLETVGERFVGRAVLVQSLSPFGRNIVFFRGLEAKILLPSWGSYKLATLLGGDGDHKRRDEYVGGDGLCCTQAIPPNICAVLSIFLCMLVAFDISMLDISMVGHAFLTGPLINS